MRETVTMTLTEFLLARIAEDEAAARGACVMYRPVGEHQNLAGEWVPIIPVGSDDRAQAERAAGFYRERGARNVEVVVFYDPARVLAECEAKRRIVELHSHTSSAVEVVGTLSGGEPFVDAYEVARCSACGTAPRGNSACMTVRLLALPYADHPDYRAEWKPDKSRGWNPEPPKGGYTAEDF
jgi:hypothetical protein